MKQSSPYLPIRRARAFTACLISLLMLMAPMTPLAASVNRTATALAEKVAARKLAKATKKQLTPAESKESGLFVNPPAPFVPNITATLTDSFIDTAPADGRADPGSVVTYTAVVSNTGPDPATGLSFTDTISPYTTLIGGSLKVSPLAFPNSYNAVQDTQLVIATGAGVLVNDTGTPAPSAVAIINGPTAQPGGIVNLATDGSFTYNPPAGFTGSDSFTYTATNGQAPPNVTDAQALVTITVGPPNAPPIANNDAVAAAEAGGLNNGTAGTNPAGNLVTGTGAAGAVADTDPEAGALTVVAVRVGAVEGAGAAGAVGSPLAGTYGSLTLNSDGSYTYTVDNNNAAVQALRTSGQTLQDAFNYTVQDPASLQDTATFIVTIAGANDNPTAVADVATAAEASGAGNGTPGTDPAGDVLTNDTDVDTLANGETRTVQGVAVGNQAGPLTTNVGIGLSGAGAANYGTLTINADGSFTYVVNNANAAVQALNSGGTLTDTFSYTMKDAANATSTTTLTITIGGADDNPAAVNDSATVNEDVGATAVDVLTNDTDVDAGTKNIASFTAPANGTVLGVGPLGAYTGLTYQPNGNYCNDLTATVDTFTYTLNGGSIGTASMTVICQNDAPVNTVPGAQSVDDNATLTFNTANTNLISVADFDIGAGNFQITVSIPATKGTLVPTASGATIGGSGTNSVVITGNITQVNAALDGMVYTPPTGLTQAIILTVLTSDQNNTGAGGAQSDTDTITITVNAPPAAVDDPYQTPQNTPLTVPAATGVLGNDTVNTASIVSYGTPTGGEQTTIGAATPTSAGGSVMLNADGSLSYTVPNAGFTGPDTFKYTLTNARGSSTATVTITVTLPNTPPTANNDAAAATEAGGANNGTAGTNPAGNLVTGTGSAGAVADTDTQDLSTALIVASVRLGNVEGAGAAGTVGAPFAGTYGSLTLNSDGSYTYTVDNNNALVQALRTSGQTLTDSFNYTVQDTGSLQDIAVFTVTIAGANDNPTAVADVATAVEASGTANGTLGTDPTGNVLPNDTDPDTVANGETQTVQGVAAGNQAGPLTLNVGVGVVSVNSYGTLTINADGSFTYVVNNANATVQALNTGGTLTDTFSYTMKDAANATSTTTVTITINGADDNPAAVNDSATVNEDAGATAVVVLTNDTDVDGGTKNIASFTAPANGTVLGVGPVGAYTGLTYQPAPNYCNNAVPVDTFTYTLNGGSIGTVSMTVTCVNDPPVNTVPGPQFVADTGTLTFSSGNANQISVADLDVGGSNVQVTVSVPATKGTLSGAGFTGNGTNSVTITNTLVNVNTALNGLVYTPPPGSSQQVTLTVLTSDLGNFGTGGIQTDSDTVTINIDQGPTVTATTPSTPAATNADLTITFNEPVAVSATDWFQIVCATTGTRNPVDTAVGGGATAWTINPNTDFATGELCTVTVFASKVNDNDTNDPPDFMAANHVFSFTVDLPPKVTTTTPANTSLSNLKTTNVTINFNENINATANGATINCGAGNIAFAGLPQTNVNSLVLNPTADLPPGSTCTVTVVAAEVTDNDTADPPNQLDGNGDGTEGDNYVFTFGVAPDAVNDGYNSTGNVGIVIAANGVLANDIGTGAVVDRVGTLTANTAVPATVPTANGGSVTLNADGSFNYTPVAGQASGTDTFKYRITNAGGVSADGTVTITITNIVWFICDGCVSSNQGTLQNPYTSVFAFSDKNGDGAGFPAANQRIYIRSGTYDAGNDNLVLLAGQLVSGQGQSATSFFTPEANSQPAYAALAAGTRPIIAPTAGNTVLVANGNTINHFNIGSSSSPTGSALLTGPTTGNWSLTASNMAINGRGRALDLSTASGSAVTLSATLDHVVTTSSTTTGITLTRVNGTLTINNTDATSAISGATGDDFFVNDGTATISYPGTITNTAARSVNIANRTTAGAGSVTFSGAISDTGTGILLDNNDTSTITFRGGLTLTTTVNTAFNATNGGTVEVCDENPCNSGATGVLVNTLTTTTGTALNVTNTTIGSNNLEFKSISSSGGSSNGIILVATGSSGGLKVVGDGTNTTVGGNSSGGTISNKGGGADGSTTDGSGIYMDNTSNVVLRRMTINGTNTQHGIRGFRVNNFTLEYSTVTGTMGDSAAFDNYGEGSVMFGDDASANTNGMTGVGTVTSCIFGGGRARNFSVVNTAGTLNRLTITGSTFNHNQNGNASSSFESRIAGTVMNVTITGSTFTGSPGDAANFTSQTGTNMDVIFGGVTGTRGTAPGNTITNNHPNNNTGGSNLTFATQGAMTFHCLGNLMSGANGSAVTFFKASSGTSMQGFFNNNEIGTNGVAGSGSLTANGIFVSAAGTGTMSYTITNNIIRRVNGNFHISADNTGGSYQANFDIRGNTFDQPGPTLAGAIGMTNGSPGSGDTVNVCAVIGGSAAADKNTIGGFAAIPTIYLGSSGVNNSATHIFNLPGLATFTEAGVQTFVAGNNTMGGTSVDAYVDAPATFAAFKGNAGCGTPTSFYRPETNQRYQLARSGSTVKPTKVAQPVTQGAQPVALRSNASETVKTAKPSSSVARGKDVEATRLPEVIAAHAGSRAKVQSAARTRAFANHAVSSSARIRAAAVKPITPMSGETVTANVGVLPAGKSVAITFQVTLNTAMPAGTSQVSTQGSVSYNDGLVPIANPDGANAGLGPNAIITVLTDDPGTGPVGDATITPIDAPTASDSSVSGQILDNNGNPVEGAAVHMTGTQNRLTVTDAAGNYHFDDVDTNGFYTVVPSRANFAFSPTQRSFSQQGQNTNAAFNATLANAGLNPLDTTVYFVRQQYVDFLGREPDEAGLNFWVNNIESCGANAQCREAKRIDTSAAFFLSIEFQETGYLVYRMYQSAYGDMPGTPVPLSRSEFKPDTAAIGNGVVVLKSGWETVLDSNKQAFAAAFVQRSRFASAYQSSLTPSEFVDKLFANAGVTPSESERTAAISEFGAAATSADAAARGRALRRVAENGVLAQREFNQAFVLMEYFGYLQRDANAGQDTDFTGYNFWLSKLNTFNGNFHQAEMVKAFLTSIEYRGRFPR